MDQIPLLIGAGDRLIEMSWLFVLEGQVAAIAGLSIAINPYAVGSLQSERWLDGWAKVLV
jgi:hypothetical protein